MTSAAHLLLDRDAGAASVAREFVAARLSECGADELRDTAALVTTELVTNVLVHTDCAPTVRVLTAADHVRVEVLDGCTVLPVAGTLDPTANCGRGLVIVEQLTHRWGVTRVPETGKAVWFELVTGVPTAAEELSAEQLLSMWDDDEAAAPDIAGRPEARPVTTDEAGPVRHVRIEGVPTALLQSTKAHLDELVRDLSLVNEAAHAQGRAEQDLLDLAGRLSHLAADLVGFRNQMRRQALDAASRAVETLTLELDLPVRLRGRLLDYRDALDEADRHCAAGRLLVAAAADEQARFRRWKLDRIIEQLADSACTRAVWGTAVGMTEPAQMSDNTRSGAPRPSGLEEPGVRGGDAADRMDSPGPGSGGLSGGGADGETAAREDLRKDLGERSGDLGSEAGDDLGQAAAIGETDDPQGGSIQEHGSRPA